MPLLLRVHFTLEAFCWNFWGPPPWKSLSITIAEACNEKCVLNSTRTIFSQPFSNLRIERERWGKTNTSSCAVVIWTNAVNGSNHSSLIRADFFIFLSQWKWHSVITRTADAQIGTYAVILPNLDSSLPKTCNFFLLLLYVNASEQYTLKEQTVQLYTHAHTYALHTWSMKFFFSPAQLLDSLRESITSTRMIELITFKGQLGLWQNVSCQGQSEVNSFDCGLLCLMKNYTVSTPDASSMMWHDKSK